MMELQDARGIRPEQLEERRKQAIALHAEGLTQARIGEIVGVHRNTVGQWIAKWKAGGPKALRVKSSGRPVGSGRHLSAREERTVQRMIVDRQPDQLKMDFALWTRDAVGLLIEQEYGFAMPVRTVGEYLKRWGFTPQKPVRRAYERNPAQVERWLKRDYPRIARKARREGAQIHWGDETGLRSDQARGRGYAPKGKAPVRQMKGTPEKINMISSVTNQGTVRFMFYRRSLCAAVLIEFMKRLIKDAGRGGKLYLILDNLRVHHARKVREWVQAHPESIELYYLPSYAPDLNPDEFLNGDLKGEVGKRPDARTKGRLARTALGAMRRIQKQPARVRKYFHAPSIRYAL